MPVNEVDLPECGVARFLLLFDGPWATLIVRELLHGPRRVVYELTDLGRQLQPVLDAMCAWGEKAPVSAFVPQEPKAARS